MSVIDCSVIFIYHVIFNHVALFYMTLFMRLVCRLYV